MSQFCEHRNGIESTSGCLVLIGIGANLPGPGSRTVLETCQQAIAMIRKLPGVAFVRISRWYESAPIPPSGQPHYINAVAALTVAPNLTIDPAALLARLMEIETVCGRERSTPNAARTLDLDIIAIGNLVRDTPDPVLPHPRAHLRAFVLAPVSDVAPAWVHPILGQTAADLLAGLPSQEIRAMS